MTAKYLIKPAMKLTSAQWKKLLSRVILKQTETPRTISKAAMEMAPVEARPFVPEMHRKVGLEQTLEDRIRMLPPQTLVSPESSAREAVLAGQTPPGLELPELTERLSLAKRQMEQRRSALETRTSASRLGQPGPMMKPTSTLPAETGPLPREIEEVLKYQPERAHVLGRLFTEEGTTGESIRQPHEFPWFEAVGKYLQEPTKWMPETTSPPPMDVLSWRPTKTGMEASYERKIYRPVKEVAGKARKAVMSLTEEEKTSKKAAQETEKKMAKYGRTIQKADKMATTKIPTEERLEQAALLGQIWKTLGGKRTITGRTWEMFRAAGRGRHKVATAEEYFTRIGLKWMADPEATVKTYPREVRLLKEIFSEFATDIPLLERFLK